jgi:hypothetical protein
MTGGLGDFLKLAWDWVWEWWPIRIVRQWEQGIRIRAGKVTKLLRYDNGPLPGLRGLHFFWPRLGEIIIEECNWELTQTDLQSLTTKDGEVVSMSFALQFRIRDLGLYYLNLHDHEASLLETVRAAAGMTVPECDWETLRSAAWRDTMYERVRKSIHGWGLEVKLVAPTTLVSAQTFRLIMDGGVD